MGDGDGAGGARSESAARLTREVQGRKRDGGWGAHSALGVDVGPGHDQPVYCSSVAVLSRDVEGGDSILPGKRRAGTRGRADGDAGRAARAAISRSTDAAWCRWGWPPLCLQLLLVAVLVDKLRLDIKNTRAL